MKEVGDCCFAATESQYSSRAPMVPKSSLTWTCSGLFVQVDYFRVARHSEVKRHIVIWPTIPPLLPSESVAIYRSHSGVVGARRPE